MYEIVNYVIMASLVNIYLYGIKRLVGRATRVLFMTCFVTYVIATVRMRIRNIVSNKTNVILFLCTLFEIERFLGKNWEFTKSNDDVQNLHIKM